MKKITATIDKESNRTSERGVSLIITLMVMAMLLGFVAMALTRVASEARVASNDSAEARTLAVSEAGLEDATRDFASLLENKISPTDDDLTKIKNEPVDQYTRAPSKLQKP
jgi:Tfp pilus assembly protein PilX